MWQKFSPQQPQALEHFDKLLKASTDSDGTDNESEQKEMSSFLSSMPSIKDHPKFEISHSRKFEVAEMCEIFFNKYLKLQQKAVAAPDFAEAMEAYRTGRDPRWE